jgi:hypothetical protein
MPSSWNDDWYYERIRWRARGWVEWSESDWRDWDNLRWMSDSELRSAPVALTRATMPVATGTIGQDHYRRHQQGVGAQQSRPESWPWHSPQIQMDQIEQIEPGRSQRDSDGAMNESEAEAQIELSPPSPERSQGDSDGGAVESEVQVQTEPSPSPERSRRGDSEHAVVEEAQVESPERSRGDGGTNTLMVDSAVQTEPTEPSPPRPERPGGADRDMATWSWRDDHPDVQRRPLGDAALWRRTAAVLATARDAAEAGLERAIADSSRRVVLHDAQAVRLNAVRLILEAIHVHE